MEANCPPNKYNKDKNKGYNKDKDNDVPDDDSFINHFMYRANGEVDERATCTLAHKTFSKTVIFYF